MSNEVASVRGRLFSLEGFSFAFHSKNEEWHECECEYYVCPRTCNWCNRLPLRILDLIEGCSDTFFK